MKYKLIFLSGLVLFLAYHLNGQEKSKIEAINKIVVSSGILLQIEKAPEYTLSIMTQDLDSKCLTQSIENGVLTLKLLNAYGCREKVNATLTCPEIPDLEIMGMAEVTTKNLFAGDKLEVKLQSGGKAYVDLDIKYLDVKASGGASFYAEGYAVNQDITVSSSATFAGYKLEGEYVNVQASLGGIAKVCATEKLKADVGSNGYVSYACNPKEVIKEGKATGVVEAAEEED